MRPISQPWEMWRPIAYTMRYEIIQDRGVWRFHIRFQSDGNVDRSLRNLSFRSSHKGLKNQARLVWGDILFDAEVDQKGWVAFMAAARQNEYKLTELEVTGLVEPASAVPWGCLFNAM